MLRLECDNFITYVANDGSAHTVSKNSDYKTYGKFIVDTKGNVLYSDENLNCGYVPVNGSDAGKVKAFLKGV